MNFKRMRASAAWLIGAGLALGAGVACDDPLTIGNPDNPDVAAVYSTPPGVEAVVSRLFQQMHTGLYGTSNSIWPALAVKSFESASQLGNFGMGTEAAIPRTPIDNQRGNREEVEHFRIFDHLHRNARSATNALGALDRFAEQGLSIGSLALDGRARSFAWFARAFALGHVALFYDSAAVSYPGMPGEEIPPLVGAAEAMQVALESLDKALEVANATAAVSWTPIPASWMGSADGDIDIERWRQIIRSYRARFRAGVARNAEERAAVNWDLVLADATNGIIADLRVMLQSTGWTNFWINTAAESATWSQMTPMIIGMADTSGGYDAWLSVALDSRAPFDIRTPDARFPSGDSRELQQAKTPVPPRQPPAGSKLYFRNRPAGDDAPAQAWGTSYYDHFRFWGYRAGGFVDYPYPIMTKAEIDMLRAEAHLRKNQFAEAAALIDIYRTHNNLPSVAGIASLTEPVPGGSACVPRIPLGANGPTACGNIFEAMKWEKRMETAFTGFGQWFVDSRGWGDLPQGTPLEYPVPYQELDARGMPIYNSQLHKPTVGTYGL